MKWESLHLSELKWSGPITNKEEKERVARQVARLAKDGDIIGVGSGTTSFLAIQAIAKRMRHEHISCTAIPTSSEISFTCAVLGIPITTLQQCRPDWSFDGADEVDPSKNLIKGRGGALFLEKLIIVSSPKSYIIIDKSKLVQRLGEKFAVPVEIHPLSLNYVEKRLFDLGASEVILRLALKKDGPVITEHGNFLLDVRFPEVKQEHERQIKLIPGVIESGLFISYNVDVLLSA